MSDDQDKKTPTLGQVFGSVFAAFIGVQRSDRHERDFAHGKPGQYIAVALVFTLVFVMLIWGVVMTVMHFAGV